MKRSAIKRHKYLDRSGPVKKVNAKRARKRFKDAFGEKGVWLRTLPCAIRLRGRVKAAFALDLLRCGGDVQVMHTKSRGSGGRSQHTIPACAAHHHEQHLSGIKTFAAKYDLDLLRLAESYERAWQERQTGAAA